MASGRHWPSRLEWHSPYRANHRTLANALCPSKDVRSAGEKASSRIWRKGLSGTTMSTYAPWIGAVFFALVIVFVRLLTNRILQNTLKAMPKWASALYLLGFVGLLAMFLWSMFAIAWWACLPVAAIYGLTCLVPSVVQQAAGDPKIVHLAAMQQAAEELKYLPSGDAKMKAIMVRADQIMHSQGWIPKPPS